MTDDNVNHPKHYTKHPSGVECIQVTEYFNFNIGNAVKYLWRAGLKGDALEDLQKARWYVTREIDRLLHGRTEAEDSPTSKAETEETTRPDIPSLLPPAP